MKILWVCMVKFPPLCEHLGVETSVYCGWLYSSAKVMIEEYDIELSVAVPTYTSKFSKHIVAGITYYQVPINNIADYNKQTIKYCCQVIDDVNPHVIHIHGTEYSLASAFCIANNKKHRIIANLQGLASVIARYTDASLTIKDHICNISPLDFFRGTFMLKEKYIMLRRAQKEKSILSKLTDVIGRTSWDYAHALTINPELKYHFMNETLRDSFYEQPIWEYTKCIKHSIFVSNSNPAYKGAHMVIKALPTILRYFPDTHIYFVGQNVLTTKFREKLRFQGYHLYLCRLIKKMGLEKYVTFYGSLSEVEMKQAFLDAHVYILPSAIENSPNSLCEAQILGVPVISSFCGGTPDLVQHGKTGFLYRYEEHEMLSHIVINLFKMQSYEELSRNERNVALTRHDKKMNAKRLYDIYCYK